MHNVNVFSSLEMIFALHTHCAHFLSPKTHSDVVLNGLRIAFLIFILERNFRQGFHLVGDPCQVEAKSLSLEIFLVRFPSSR